jgi:hypothetical protein
VSASPFDFLAGAKPAEWLAKPTFWLASRNAGRGLVITAKSTPTPETSQSVRAQATFASQKVNSHVEAAFGSDLAVSQNCRKTFRSIYLGRCRAPMYEIFGTLIANRSIPVQDLSRSELARNERAISNSSTSGCVDTSGSMIVRRLEVLVSEELDRLEVSRNSS